MDRKKAAQIGCRKEVAVMISEIQTQVYAGRVKDKESLMLSSSGGVFTVFSEFF